ncbi:MAG: 30S ribosomal protein S2 [Candidatus Absconditabacterales bacterium]|nr:30S ribosomal protein S2 [Candidatus Absconditabacterales bacterium]
MTLDTQSLIKHHVCVGSLSNVLKPATRKYWSDVSGSFITFDPELVVQQISAARQKIKKYLDEKKNILIISQKDMIREEVVSLCESRGLHYMVHKTPGGFLTNFNTLIKKIQVMNEKKMFLQSENFASITKKEQEQARRVFSKVERVYAGVAKLESKPDLVIVIDGAQMHSVVKELALTGIDNIVMASSDFSQRRPANNLITMNVSSYDALTYVLRVLFAS